MKRLQSWFDRFVGAHGALPNPAHPDTPPYDRAALSLPACWRRQARVVLTPWRQHALLIA